MGEFADVVRRRRMTRSFATTALPAGMIDEFVDLASRAPSAGKTQGWHLVALEGDETARFWDITLPPMRRGRFKWQGLLDAPAILLPFADAKAYTDRYSEPDKAATGLGAGPEAWPSEPKKRPIAARAKGAKKRSPSAPPGILIWATWACTAWPTNTSTAIWWPHNATCATTAWPARIPPPGMAPGPDINRSWHHKASFVMPAGKKKGQTGDPYSLPREMATG